MNKYKIYADLKKKISELSAQAKELEKDIFDEVSGVDGNKLETKYATFSVMYRPKWEYSDDLQDKEKLTKLRIKQLKAEEEKSGKALKISDGGFLRCQIRKEK
jgi:hypothetical protein